jgi:hypothetical protein
MLPLQIGVIKGPSPPGIRKSITPQILNLYLLPFLTRPTALALRKINTEVTQWNFPFYSSFIRGIKAIRTIINKNNLWQSLQTFL